MVSPLEPWLLIAVYGQYDNDTEQPDVDNGWCLALVIMHKFIGDHNQHQLEDSIMFGVNPK